MRIRLGPPRALSIRYAVPGLLAIVIVASVGIAALLAYYSGQASANEAAARLSQEVAGRIREGVAAVVETPQQFNDINVAAWKSGNLNLRDFQNLERQFYNQTKISSGAQYMYYATAQGDFVGIDATSGSQGAVLLVRDAATAPNRLSYKLDANGAPVGQPGVDEYDPRTQPFFQDAADARRATWSPVYTLPGRGSLGIVAATPVYTATGTLQGVFGISLTLDGLTAFLRSLKPSPNGTAFIVERDGSLIATSTPNEPIVVTGATEPPKRLSALDSGDGLTQNTAKHLMARFGGFDHVPLGATGATGGNPAPLAFTFDYAGQQQFGHVISVSDGRGLDWLIVVVVPADDFMAQANANARATAVLVAVALVLAAIPGYLFASRILRPVTTVMQVATSVEEGRYELDRLDDVAKRTDELGQLARIFRRMATEVFAREQQLRQQIVQLRIEIDEAKRQTQVREIVETDFFKDLQAKAQEARQEKAEHQRRSTAEDADPP